MDVRAVLEGTLKPDFNVRSSAEQQLNAAAQADFPGYLSILTQELANEESTESVRQSAALALKNAFFAHDTLKAQEVSQKWLQGVSPEIKQRIKGLAVQTLASPHLKTAKDAAQFVAVIAAIEIPVNQWPELLDTLVSNVGQGSSTQKQASLVTIGYICEKKSDVTLRSKLSAHSNAILTAVIQGARKEETDDNVRTTALESLSGAIELVTSNFENEGERNYIMQVICEATQASNSSIQVAAYECLINIMDVYYSKMSFYMEKALFGLTIQGMKSDDENVAKLAIQFWATVCETEIQIEDENEVAQAAGTPLQDYFNFARIATQEVVPVILELLTKQEEHADEDEYNLSHAAYSCLTSWAQAVGTAIIPHVAPFVERNLRQENWHYRDAAVAAFGAMMVPTEGGHLDSYVRQGLPVLISMMQDPYAQVKDSAAYALGRICEAVPESIDVSSDLQNLIQNLFQGLANERRMATSCCYALKSLAENFAGEPGCQSNALSPHFQASVSALLQVTENATDNQLRTSAYEVLNSFISNAANDSVNIVQALTDAILQRLEATLGMQQQVVSVEDRLTLQEIQTSLTTVVLTIIQRLEVEIKPYADRIMQTFLSILSTLGSKSSVPEDIFAAVGALASAIEGDFGKYMPTFSDYLCKALKNQEEESLCYTAIGLVSDFSRALNEGIQPYCDTLITLLLNNLRSVHASREETKSVILQCFGDIASAIGGQFENYLAVVAKVLKQAAALSAHDQLQSLEMSDYITKLREGIMDAWSGIIGAMRAGQKTPLLQPYIEDIFQLLQAVYSEEEKSAEPLLSASMGVIGDVAEAFPGGQYSHYFRQEFLTAMARETRANKAFSQRTQDTARWAREQIKRQAAVASGTQVS